MPWTGKSLYKTKNWTMLIFQRFSIGAVPALPRDAKPGHRAGLVPSSAQWLFRLTEYLQVIFNLSGIIDLTNMQGSYFDWVRQAYDMEQKVVAFGDKKC